jgi:hypothetical protein
MNLVDESGIGGRGCSVERKNMMVGVGDVKLLR